MNTAVEPSEAVGMSARRLERIGPAMQAYVDRGVYAGVNTLIARRGKVVHCRRIRLARQESDATTSPTPSLATFGFVGFARPPSFAEAWHIAPPIKLKEPSRLRIATWNVNSVRQRLPHLLAYLKEVQPDVLCLQEIKCLDEQFPRMEIEELGYNIETHGQKTFNGVAILSKRPFEVARGLPGDENNSQSRYIEAVVPAGDGVVRVAASICRTAIPWARKNILISSPSWSGSSSMPASSSNTRSRWCWRAISMSFPTRATSRVPRTGSTTLCSCRRRGSNSASSSRSA